MTRRELQRRLDLVTVRQAGAAHPELASLLRVIGLLD
jgi:hypothetical protein